MEKGVLEKGIYNGFLTWSVVYSLVVLFSGLWVLASADFIQAKISGLVMIIVGFLTTVNTLTDAVSD